MGKSNGDRNLKYHRNEKRVNDTYNENMKVEDTTQYGEFVSSFHKWIPPEEQKQNAKKLNNITKRKKR